MSKQFISLDDFRKSQHEECIQYIKDAVAHFGTQTKAAEALGVSKDSLGNALYRRRHPRRVQTARATPKRKLISYAGTH